MAPSTMGPGPQRVSLVAVNPLSCPQGEGLSPPWGRHRKNPSGMWFLRIPDPDPQAGRVNTALGVKFPEPSRRTGQSLGGWGAAGGGAGAGEPGTRKHRALSPAPDGSEG